MSKNFHILQDGPSGNGPVVASEVGRMIEPECDARGIRFGIVVAKFNQQITENLLRGALNAIVSFGGETELVTVVRVPGSFEIPLAAQTLASLGEVDAVIALGAVIRGGTSHYELVCQESARGVSVASLATGVPVTFGIITTENLEQAIERSGEDMKTNKGAEAAVAAIEMVQVLKQFAGEDAV